jgi:hypothetical protein
MSSIELGLLKENEKKNKVEILKITLLSFEITGKFSGQPSQSGGKRKGIVLICLMLCLQLAELHMRYKFHPMNPNKKHTFSKVLNLKLCQQLKH